MKKLFRRLLNMLGLEVVDRVKLSSVPCEYSELFSKKSEFGMRVANVLKRINFPNRDRTVISVRADDEWASIKMATEVTDSNTGGLLELTHHGNIKINSTDAEIATHLFVILGQYAIHEFMENFRYEGKILFDPHQGGGSFQRPIFNAIKDCTVPKPKTEFAVARQGAEHVEFVVTVPNLTPPAQNFDTKENQEKTKRKEKFYAKFVPPAWDYRLKRTA